MAIGLLGVVLASCSSVDDAPADAASDGVVDIRMEDNRFVREVVRIEVGDTVRFENVGLVPHNAIDVGGTWSTGEATGGERNDVMEPGEVVEVTFDEPGSFTYYCSLHAPPDGSAGMAATLAVGAAEEQRVIVQELGADWVQGWIYGRPALPCEGPQAAAELVAAARLEGTKRPTAAARQPVGRAS